MKILLYGENWEGTHVDCISKVLREINIEFKIFDFFKILNPRTGYKLPDKVIRRLFYSQNEKLINKLLCREVDNFKPDVLFISKGVNIFPETLVIYNKLSIKVVNWNPDDFFNSYNTSKHLLNSLALYDYVFSARPHLFDEYREKGIKNPIYLEWYYIPWLHKKIDLFAQPEKKVTFIGTYSKRRENVINAIDDSFPIEVWGSGWSFSSLRVKTNITLKDKILDQSDFPGIISGSLININILTKENRDLTNLKLFEITPSFGLLLTEDNPSTQHILGNNCFYFDAENATIMNETIASIFYEKAFNQISEIRNNGFTHIISNNNSIYDRVETIIEFLK